jgi:hypothetical protein
MVLLNFISSLECLALGLLRLRQHAGLNESLARVKTIIVNKLCVSRIYLLSRQKIFTTPDGSYPRPLGME